MTLITKLTYKYKKTNTDTKTQNTQPFRDAVYIICCLVEVGIFFKLEQE